MITKMKHLIFIAIIISIPLIGQEIEFNSIPIQESGRIKPMDTYANNQLLLLYGKKYFKNEESENIRGVDWLLQLITNPTEELNKKIFFISNWSNSPEVEISLGLDGRDSHLYSFYEILEGFKNNQSLLDGLKNKSQDDYSNVEKQIVDVYSKIVLLDEIAHSLTCLIPQITIDNQEVLDALELDNNNKVSYFFFIKNIHLFSPLMQELLDTPSENWTDKHLTLNRIALELHSIGQYQYAKSLKIIPAFDGSTEWLSPWEVMDLNKINQNQMELILELDMFLHSYLNNDKNYILNNYVSQLESVPNIPSLSKLNKEINYNKYNYFNKSLIFYLLALILLGIGWLIKPTVLKNISFSFLLIGFLFHCYGIIIRMIIMSRPPVTTLYESILFVSFVLVLIAIIFEFVKKDTFGILIGSIGGSILHYIGLKYAADGDTLGMLVAVLNSNFWLSIHVTTITFGYGVSLVAGLMGHLYLIACLFKNVSKNVLKKIYKNAYVLTLIALFFTLFGTILGGIWADQSWGRFWGWDPKENGALLIVMWHLMVLHMKVSKMVKDIGFCLMISFVNIIVALAWFGVNLLNVGLHSYGFTDSVANNLFLFIFIEILFIIGCYVYVISTNNKENKKIL